MTLMATMAFMMVCEDFAFHWIHKMMHSKLLYPSIHKVHHIHRTTIGIAAEYAHPVDFILGSLIPGVLGALILGQNIHIYSFWMWGIIRLGETLDGHSGYEFSWSPYRLIPFSSSARYHDFHHSNNVGNYSSFFSFWDTICGTNKVYFQFYERMREAREANERKKLQFENELSSKLEKEITKKTD